MTGDVWRGSLVGLPWSLAREVLHRRGVLFRTVATGPPGKPVHEGEERVVQERQEPEGLLVVLARYRPHGSQEGKI